MGRFQINRTPLSPFSRFSRLPGRGLWLLLCALALGAVSCGKFNASSSSNSSNSTVAADAARLTWTAPTLNSDLTTLTDLAGYRVYMGQSPGSYTQNIDVGNVLTYTFTGLSVGTYYFTVKAYDTSGNLSSAATESSKVIK